MDEKRALSTQEVADMLHVSKSMIYELIRQGAITSYKVGRKVRFMESDVKSLSGSPGKNRRGRRWPRRRSREARGWKERFPGASGLCHLVGRI